MGNVNRSLWLEALTRRVDAAENKRRAEESWVAHAGERLRSVSKACQFFGFHVETLDARTISVTPEHLYNEMVNVDASTLRMVRPEGYTVGSDDSDVFAVEVTFAPSVRRMVERERGPFEDPPRDDEELELVPESPVLMLLPLLGGDFDDRVRERLEPHLAGIVERLIDLKFPPKKED